MDLRFVSETDRNSCNIILKVGEEVGNYVDKILRFERYGLNLSFFPTSTE